MHNANSNLLKKIIQIALIILVYLYSMNSFDLTAKEKDKKGNNQISNSTQNPSQSLMNINNITSWVRADGYHDWIVNSSWNGAFPNGSEVGVIFAEGIEWGGKVNDGQTPVIRVNGNDYGTGCQSIFNEPRVYRVRSDFQFGELTGDAAGFFNKLLNSVTQDDIDSIKNQYETDWLEWPAEYGAPYLDADSNGVYDPNPDGDGIYGENGEDIPGIPNSHQTLFIAYNDNLSVGLYQSPLIGLEVHETYWAYSYRNELANVIFKKVDFIYKGTESSAPNSTIEDMYITQWSDPDIGTSSDDFAGSDTVLNLGYAYNSRSNDAYYNGIGYSPGAAGYSFLYGVCRYTGNPNDSAVFNLKWRKGYKYVNSKPVSSVIYYAGGGMWGDPAYNYDGGLEYYNYMKGLKPDGTPFPSEVADVVPGAGTYLLAGDPVSGIGKIDGLIDPAGDRRLLVINGPFDLRLGDTAEVVIALVGGIGGTDNLENVTRMKQNAQTAQINFFNAFHLTDVNPAEQNSGIPAEYKLLQNYPNPFNPSTKIQYTISSKQAVKLKVYDILGNEAAVLVNEEKPAGTYEIEFNAAGLSSGVYFYQLQAGGTILTKKLMLLK